jgi:hypothetical protein
VKRKITFKHWLRTQPLHKLPYGPEGDFVRDARDDRTLPDVQSWRELRGYLLWNCNACSEAITAAAGVWNHYNEKVPA